MLILGTPHAVSASPISTTIISTDSPVAIDFCEAFQERVVVIKSSGKIVPFGKVSPFDVSSENTITNAMHLGVTFRNVSEQTATAVKVEFRANDMFGAQKFPIKTATFAGTYSPNVLIERTKTGADESLTLGWGEDVGGVTCSAIAVRFADGSVWKAGDKALSSTASSDLHSAELHGDPSTHLLRDYAHAFPGAKQSQKIEAKLSSVIYSTGRRLYVMTLMPLAGGSLVSNVLDKFGNYPLNGYIFAFVPSDGQTGIVPSKNMQGCNQGDLQSIAERAKAVLLSDGSQSSVDTAIAALQTQCLSPR